MSLVDLDTDVKPWLEIAPAVISSDDVLQLCMESAIEFFESYTNRVLEEQDLTEQYNGNGTHVMGLRQFPVSQVLGVSIDAAWLFPTSEDSASYILDNDVFLVRKEVWPQGIRNIQVTYTAGYTPDDAPVDLKLASLQMIEFLYKGRGDHRLGVTNRNKIGESLTFQDSVPKTILDLIAPYVREKAVADLVRRAGG